MKIIFLVILVFLVSCSSPRTKQNNINNCLTLSKKFYKYKYEPLINCNNQCIQSEVGLFSIELNKFLNPYLINAQNFDKKKILPKGQLAYIKNSNSSEFCGNLNQNLKKIFTKTNNKKGNAKNRLINLIKINTRLYYDVLLKANKTTIKRQQPLNKTSNKIIGSTKQIQKDSKKNIKKAKLKKIKKMNLLQVENCKESLQDLRYHILTKGKNNKLYKIYQHMYSRCLKTYSKRRK